MSKRQKSSTFMPRGDSTAKVRYPGQKVKVTYFAKPCPKCGEPTRVTKKMSAWWYECRKCDWRTK